MQKPHIAYVATVPQNAANGKVAEAYHSVKGTDGIVENLYLAMSQTPDAIAPADAHYLALLHNDDNPLDPWLSELISTYVAILCDCEYAAVNHGANFRMYFADDTQADAIINLLKQDDLSQFSFGQMRVVLEYTRKLSLTPGAMGENDIFALREAGFCDKGISYIIQIASSFAYWSRMINGLGTKLGDRIGIQNCPRDQSK
jgi:uncharacterized peroxidase-related enzyme